MFAFKLTCVLLAVTSASASVLHHGFAPAIAPAIAPAFPAIAPVFGPAIAPAFAPAIAPAIGPFAFGPAPLPFGFGAPVFKPHVAFAYPAPVFKPHYHFGYATPVLKAHLPYPVFRTFTPFAAPVVKALPYSVHYHKSFIPPAPHFKSFASYAPTFGHSHFIA